MSPCTLIVGTFALFLADGAAAYAPIRAGVRTTASAMRVRALRRPVMTTGPMEVDDTWTTTDSGLSFLDVKAGSGDAPAQGQVVKVKYTGWLESTGAVFDSSEGRAPFAVAIGEGRVIPGWDEGISTMCPGGIRRLSIPAELGYGEAGSPPTIPPNSRLQFECTLEGVEDGVSGFAATFPGGIPNLVLVTLLGLSFIPYFLPEDIKPTQWM